METRIEAILREKRELFDRVLDGTWASRLDRLDVASLLRIAGAMPRRSAAPPDGID